MPSVSLFGATGFIGTAYSKFSKNVVDSVDRNYPNPLYNEIVYSVGTSDNYNVLENPFLDVESNILKLIEDLEIMRAKFGTFSINFLSTWFVYGDATTPPFSEDQRCDPKGFYSISKYAAEMFLRSYCNTYGLNYRILRLANVFGLGDNKASKKRNALQFLINEIKAGRDIDLYEGGDFFRDYIDVRDVVSAIDLILEKCPNSETINVGSGVPSRFADLMLKVKSTHQSSSEFRNISTPNFHRTVQVRDAYLNVSKLKSLGFIPRYSIDDEIIKL